MSAEIGEWSPIGVSFPCSVPDADPLGMRAKPLTRHAGNALDQRAPFLWDGAARAPVVNGRREGRPQLFG